MKVLSKVYHALCKSCAFITGLVGLELRTQVSNSRTECFLLALKD